MPGKKQFMTRHGIIPEYWVRSTGNIQRKSLPRLGLMDLNSLIMQDDISKMNDRLDDARSGSDKIDDTLKRKQLSVNYDKSKYLIIGSQKFRNETLKELNEKPMNMGGVINLFCFYDLPGVGECDRIVKCVKCVKCV